MVNSMERGTNGYWLKSLASEMLLRRELRFHTDRRENLVDITKEINAVISESSLDSGVCNIYVPHATSGVVVNENDDPNIIEDVLETLRKMAPRGSFLHDKIDGNGDAHVKSAIMGPMNPFLLKTDGCCLVPGRVSCCVNSMGQNTSAK